MPRQKIIAADIETADGLLGSKFMVGCICTGTNTYTFYDCDEFVENLMRYEFPRYRIYFHNLQFDIRFILEYFRERNIPIINPVIRGSQYIAQEFPSAKSGKRVMVCDSMALMPLSLEKIAKIFSLEQKVKMSFDGSEDAQKYAQRCAVDSQILHEAIMKFYGFFPAAKGAFTLPQAAMRDFRPTAPNFSFTTQRIGKEIVVDTKLEQIARDGYHGGRNEIFSLKRYENANYYDVNSLYPYVMKEHEYPISIHHDGTAKALNEELYIADAEVEIPQCYIPVLPSRLDKLYFTTGRFRGWFYSPEFRLIENIANFRIYDSYTFTPSRLFKNWVDKWYSLRLQHKRSGSTLEKVDKLIMNSLYGKFAQKRETECVEYIFDIEPGSYVEEITDGVFIKKTTKFSKSSSINPFISGFITSYARAHLWGILSKLDNAAIYCDTDSVITTDRLATGDGIGELKLEGRGVFQAFAPKIYFFCGDDGKAKHKAKGIPKRLIPDTDDVDAFVSAIRKTEITEYAKPRESIRRYGHFVAVKSMKKVLQLNYDKREVMPDMTTMPYDYIDITNRLAPAIATTGYSEWRKSDYYDEQMEDSTLTAHEKRNEYAMRWKDYLWV